MNDIRVPKSEEWKYEHIFKFYMFDNDLKNVRKYTTFYAEKYI